MCSCESNSQTCLNMNKISMCESFESIVYQPECWYAKGSSMIIKLLLMVQKSGEPVDMGSFSPLFTAF